MPETPVTCSKCGGQMEVGIIPEHGLAGNRVSAWQRGPAEKGKHGGLKTLGYRRFEISAYRCTACGFLECYAAE